MHAPGEQRNLIERNADGSLTKETFTRAMKAFKKRLKLARLDDESKLGREPMTKGGSSGISGILPPEQYPQEVWDGLVQRGRLRAVSHGLYELVPQPGQGD
ncbi:MAG TPA: hypothetical protein VK348_03615 [Planctomycetota bacterium]|nr:hypothetical protein [Planctomycetota bacterium]